MIKFGPSGNSESFYAEGYAHTEQAAKFVKEKGLDCFEYSFGRGVRITEEKAIAIGEAFQKEQIELLVSKQREYFKTGATLDVKFRISALKKLKEAIKKYENEIANALYDDLGKSDFESFMCETGMALSEISYLIKNTKKNGLFCPFFA